MLELLINTAYAQSNNDNPDGYKSLTDALGELFVGFQYFIIAMVVVVLAFIIAYITTRFIVKNIQSQDNTSSEELKIIIRRTIFFAIVLLGLVIALSIMGVEMMAFMGAMGFGIGFAMKDLLANFIAGYVILSGKKFRIGDLVLVNGNFGYISEMESRTTQIRTLVGTTVVVPNSDMMTNFVENYTANAYRCILIETFVHYHTHLPEAVRIMIEAAKRHPKIVAAPESKVYVTKFGSSGIGLQLRTWMESTTPWFQTKSEIIQNIKYDFDRHGITIPYNMTTLSIDRYDTSLQKAFETTLPDTANTWDKPIITDDEMLTFKGMEFYNPGITKNKEVAQDLPPEFKRKMPTFTDQQKKEDSAEGQNPLIG